MEQFATNWAKRIQDRFDLSDQDQEIVAFAITYLLLVLVNVALLCLLGLIFGLLTATLYAAVIAGLFRVFTGGAHFSTPGVCAFFSSLVMVGAAFGGRLLSQLPVWWLLPAVLFYLVYSILAYAPVESEGRPISQQEARKFKRISLGLVPLWLGLTVIISYSYPELAAASLLAVSWQAFTLSPAGQRVYSWIDRLINRLKNQTTGRCP